MQTNLSTWFERDRQHVELIDDCNETIVEWWDNEVTDAVECGFLDPADWHGSAYRYAVDRNLLTNRYVDRVIEAENATKYKTISPGILHTCDQCQSGYGMEEKELEEYSEQFGDDRTFSWEDCEVCQSPLAGDRYAAHGIAEDGSLLHYEICFDCVHYLANGTLPGVDR